MRMRSISSYLTTLSSVFARLHWIERNNNKIRASLNVEVVMWSLYVLILNVLWNSYDITIFIYFSFYLLLCNIYLLSLLGRWFGKHRFSTSFLTVSVLYFSNLTSHLIANQFIAFKISYSMHQENQENLARSNCFIDRPIVNELLKNSIYNNHQFEFYVGATGNGKTLYMKKISYDFDGIFYYDFKEGNSLDDFANAILAHANLGVMYSNFFNVSSTNFELISKILIKNKKYFFSLDPNHLPIFIFDNVGALKSSILSHSLDKKYYSSIKWNSDFTALIKFAEIGIKTHSFKSIFIDNSLGSFFNAQNIVFESHLMKFNIFPEITIYETHKYIKCIKDNQEINDDLINALYKSIGGNIDHINAFLDIKSSYDDSSEMQNLNNDLNDLNYTNDINYMSSKNTNKNINKDKNKNKNVLNYLVETQAQKYFQELGIAFQIGTKFSKNLNFFELKNRDIKRIVDTMILIKKIVNEMKELELNDEIESLIYDKIFISPIFIKYWKNNKKYINFQSTIFLEFARKIVGFNDSNQKSIFENQIEFLNSKKTTKCKCKKY